MTPSRRERTTRREPLLEEEKRIAESHRFKSLVMHAVAMHARAFDTKGERAPKHR